MQSDEEEISHKQRPLSEQYQHQSYHDATGSENDSVDEFLRDTIDRNMGALEYHNMSGKDKFWYQYEWVREKAWKLLESENVPGKILNYLIFGLILVSVFCFILMTDKQLSEVLWLTWTTEIVEYICVAFFSVEYLVRLWSCTSHRAYYAPKGWFWGRLRFIVSLGSLIDIIAILPTYVSLVALLSLGEIKSNSEQIIARDFLTLRMLRLLRLLKGEKLFQSWTMIRKVFQKKKKELVTSYFVISVCAITLGSMIYVFERDSPEFDSILKALWFVLITLSTVGYGEMIPHTTMGRILTSILCVAAISAFAVPTSIFSTGFIEVLNEQHQEEQEELERQRRKREKEGRMGEFLSQDTNIPVNQQTPGVTSQEMTSITPCLRCPHCSKTAPMKSFELTLN